MTEMKPVNPVHSDASAEPRDSRVSTLVGDRLCIRCHYNLCGQPVLRDGHYDMLIVRCPECGTVASLQEHPMLGRWASRWAVVLVGVWLLTLLGLWLIMSGIVYGMSQSVGTKATEPYARHIADLQDTWMKETGTEDEWQSFWRFSNATYHSALHSEWWREQDAAALLTEVGGWRRIADWRAMGLLVMWSPLLIAFGCAWALLLPHVRRRWLPIWSLGLIALALLFVLVSSFDPFGFSDWQWSIGETVYPQVGMKVQVTAIFAMAVPLSVGLLLGRTVARLLVRAILPPRLRGSLAALWTIDNLPPPPGARVGRV